MAEPINDLAPAAATDAAADANLDEGGATQVYGTAN